jgi:hypothetical protein
MLFIVLYECSIHEVEARGQLRRCMRRRPRCRAAMAGGMGLLQGKVGAPPCGPEVRLLGCSRLPTSRKPKLGWPERCPGGACGCRPGQGVEDRVTLLAFRSRPREAGHI